MKSTRLREQLDTHCHHETRVTVFWSCGGQVFCTTGKVVDLFDDVLVVVGFTPTARETLAGDHAGGGDGQGDDCNALELVTFINLESVCAVVADVPHCRQACLPRCCRCKQHQPRDVG